MPSAPTQALRLSRSEDSWHIHLPPHTRGPAWRLRNNLASYILSLGGFLGMGTHYVAVAPGSIAVTWNESDNKWHARINATKDQLKAAPQFKYEGRFAK
ncbi:hypothetical protein C8D03_2484 [Bosea sp. 124]|nr:hypothetical protein C8D03_2484 [Bosea sp. 124]